MQIEQDEKKARRRKMNEILSSNKVTVMVSRSITGARASTLENSEFKLLPR
jgi:hypothetical protein